MIMTILEANVTSHRYDDLKNAYQKGTHSLPPQLVETFLVRSAANPDTWRIITIWKSREALEEMRRSTEVPSGILMFRAAGAEPSLSIFEVESHHRNPAG